MSTSGEHPPGGLRAAELDLLGVLETAAAKSPRLLKSGLPNLAFFRAANQALCAPDDEEAGHGFPQVEFWTTLAMENGLLGAADGRLAVGGAADDFFALPAADRATALRRFWLNSRSLNEFLLCPTLEFPGLRSARTVDSVTDIPGAERLSEARRAVVAALADLRDRTPLDRFVERMEREARDFLIDHREDDHWRFVFYRGVRAPGDDEDLERQGNWRRVEGAFLAMLAAFPLERLGYLRWDAARRVLSPPAPEADLEGAEIVIQPNFEVVILGDGADPSMLWRLARMAEPQPSERVRSYKLTRKSFSEALARGGTADELTAFLESLSRTPLPQNVRYALRDWGELTERIRIWPDALFLEAEGVEDLRASLPGRLTELLAPHFAGPHGICPVPKLASLREALPARRTVLDYARELPRVVRPDRGLEFTAAFETLHFRARRTLALLTVPVSADRFRLDRARIDEAAEALGAETVRAALEALLVSPLSPEMALALRTWSGESSAPFVGEAELLLFESAEAAALAMEMPEVKRCVQRKLSPVAFLLARETSPQVREVLRGIGIPLSEGSVFRAHNR